MTQEPTPERERAAPQRRPYRRPRLLDYGPVEKLTRTGTSASGDGGAMMMSMCL